MTDPTLPDRILSRRWPDATTGDIRRFTRLGQRNGPSKAAWFFFDGASWRPASDIEIAKAESLGEGTMHDR